MIGKKFKLSFIFTALVLCFSKSVIFAAQNTPTTERLSGSNRYAISSTVVLNKWVQSDYAILVCGEDFSDDFNSVLNIKILEGISSIVNEVINKFIDMVTTSIVTNIEVTSNYLTKAGTNTATFKYKLSDRNGRDITETIPSSDIVANSQVGSSSAVIELNPLTKTGTIIYNFSNTDKDVTIQLACNNEIVTTTISLEEVTSKETTMKEAISIAYEKTEQMSPNAKLTKSISTDAMTNPSKESGFNGTCNVWNTFFKDTKSNCEYNIYVAQGKVQLFQQGGECTDEVIEDSDIKLDSTDAIKIAKEQKKLKPGIPNVNWAIGYHFNLEYASFYNIPGKNFLIIEVIGISPKGNFAHVDIDESTGKIIYSGEETYDSNGRSSWTPF